MSAYAKCLQQATSPQRQEVIGLYRRCLRCAASIKDFGWRTSYLEYSQDSFRRNSGLPFHSSQAIDARNYAEEQLERMKYYLSVNQKIALERNQLNGAKQPLLRPLSSVFHTAEAVRSENVCSKSHKSAVNQISTDDAIDTEQQNPEKGNLDPIASSDMEAFEIEAGETETETMKEDSVDIEHDPKKQFLNFFADLPSSASLNMDIGDIDSDEGAAHASKADHVPRVLNGAFEMVEDETTTDHWSEDRQTRKHGAADLLEMLDENPSEGINKNASDCSAENFELVKTKQLERSNDMVNFLEGMKSPKNIKIVKLSKNRQKNLRVNRTLKRRETRRKFPTASVISCRNAKAIEDVIADDVRGEIFIKHDSASDGIQTNDGSKEHQVESFLKGGVRSLHLSDKDIDDIIVGDVRGNIFVKNDSAPAIGELVSDGIQTNDRSKEHQVESFLKRAVPSLHLSDISLYAKQLVEDGFDSVEMISNELQREDLEFMKKAHARALWKFMQSKVNRDNTG